MDTLSNRTVPVLYEHDMNSAYVACLDPLPAGPMYQVFDGEEDESLGAVTSYRRWRIWVHEDVPLAPLPCRMTEGVAYRRMGEWTGWYWSEEIAEARALGWECTPMEGYYWTELTHAFRPAMARIWNLRQTAPSPQVAQLVKQAAVAGIGRWAGDMTTTRLGPDTGAGLPYIDALAGRVDGLAEIEEENDREGLLIHLASYIYAQCRLRLYRKALPYAQRGTLIATNYDAIYTVEEPTEPQGTGLGEWKWKALHNASVPKPRWLQSDEKVRMPGVSR